MTQSLHAPLDPSFGTFQCVHVPPVLEFQLHLTRAAWKEDHLLPPAGNNSSNAEDVPQRHTAGSCSTRCPPKSQGLSSSSCLPVGGSPSCSSAWVCFSPGSGFGISFCWAAGCSCRLISPPVKVFLNGSTVPPVNQLLLPALHCLGLVYRNSSERQWFIFKYPHRENSNIYFCCFHQQCVLTGSHRAMPEAQGCACTNFTCAWVTHSSNTWYPTFMLEKGEFYTATMACILSSHSFFLSLSGKLKL